MSFTKVTNTGIGSTGTVLLQNLDVIGIATAGFGVSTVDVFTTGITTFANATDSTSTTTGSVIVSGGVGIAGSLNVGGSVSVGGTLTYEDVTNVDSVGIITARSNILVGSGITLSPDGNYFATGISTISDKLFVNERVKVTGPSTITNMTQTIMAIDSADDNTIGLGGKVGLCGIVNGTQRTFAAIGGLKSVDGTGNFAGDLALYTRRNNQGSLDERLRITSAGKVGIGTEEPIGLLHISSTGVTDFVIEADSNNSNEAFNPRILFRQDGHASQSAIAIGGTVYDANIDNALTFRNSVTSSGGIIFMTNDQNGSLTPYQNHLEAVERLRIGSAGQIGIAGANYGSDNQALTSQGSSSSPEWRGINTPAWDSYQNPAHNVATSTWTLVTNLVETFDSNGAFASSAFTVPTGGAGTYFVYGYVTIDDVQAADYVICGISVDGGEPGLGRRGAMNTGGTGNVRMSSVVNCMITLAVGDVVRLSAFHNEGTTEPTEPYYTRFGGYRMSI